MKPTTWLFHTLLMALLTISPAFATTFQAEATNSLSSYSPYGVAFGNFSTSNKLDMAMTISDGSNNYVRILHGDGAGGFPSYWQLGAAAGPRSIVAADLNMDGMKDLAVSNFGDNSVSVFISNGDGTFQTRVDYTVGNGPTAIAVGDFNGNGIRDDIAVVNSTSNSVAILLNDGSGAMTVLNSSSWPTTTDAAAGIAAGDFNGDDIDDVAVGRSGAGAVRIFRGSGAAGTFLTGVDITVGTTPSALASADLDNDGLYDLAVVNNGSDNISVIKGNKISFSVNNTYSVYDPADPDANPVAITAGDFNRDGVIDLAVANNGKGTISVLTGKGDATFPLTPEIFTTGAAPSAIAYGDLNGGGNELVTLSISNQNYSLLINSSTAVAGITVTPVTHDFGKIPNTTAPLIERFLSLTIANNGSAELSISSMQLSGTGSGHFDIYPGGPMPCSGYTPSIAASSCCTMLLKATAYALGEKSAAVVIASNATNNTSVSIPLSSEVIEEPGTVDLTLSFIGRGSGHVDFSPTYTDCESPTTCSSTQSFRLVTIGHTPDSGMYFYGWSGCDYISNGRCKIDPATDRNITANFGILPRRVKLNVTWPMYTSTVTAAYASSAGNEEIRAQAGLLDENLFMGLEVSITLKGGYDSSFTTQGSPTFLRSLTVAKGSATVDNIMLK
jgi:hypothetical protein